MNNWNIRWLVICNYPKYFIIDLSGSQYWVDPHSIMFIDGGNGFGKYGLPKYGSASLGIQTSCVSTVEKYEGSMSTHFLENEFSYFYLMIKGIFY